MIVTGDLADGERINEVHLAKSLKISRTPLREGLGVLVAEGFVDTIPRRGFFVKPLSAEEFRHLFDLRPLLDPHGLRISSDFSDRQIDRLMRANDDFLSAKDGQSAVRADVKFHRLLLVNCPNLILLDLIDTLINRTARYELALFRETDRLPVAGTEHATIISALRSRDINSAADGLRDNLTSGKEPILEWLSRRSQTTKQDI
jgi:DNA-binding GntR family transcriptional regulator